MSNKWLEKEGFDFRMKGRVFYFSTQGKNYDTSKELIFKNISACKSIHSIEVLSRYLSEGSEGLKKTEVFKNAEGENVNIEDMLKKWDLISDKDNLKPNIKISEDIGDKEKFKKRQAQHIMISLPKLYNNLPREKVDDVMKDFLLPLQNFNPIYLQHRHQSNAHVHIILPTKSEDKQDTIHFSRDFTNLLKQHAGICCLENNLNITISKKPPSKRIKQDIEKELKDLENVSRPRFDKKTRKVNLEKQSPSWYSRHGLNYQVRRTGIEDKNLDYLKPNIFKLPSLDENSERNLDKWAKDTFEFPEISKNIFKEMLAEKPATAFWYANNQAIIFGNLICSKTKITQRDIKISQEWQSKITEFFNEKKEDKDLLIERKKITENISYKHTSEKYKRALEFFNIDYNKEKSKERAVDLER